MQICGICGNEFDPERYQVIVGGRGYDSFDCAQRAARALARRGVDASSDWVAAARARLEASDSPPMVEPEPPRSLRDA
jgi:hypothetical protein